MKQTYAVRLLFEPRVQLAALAVMLLVLLCFRLVQFVEFTKQQQWGYDFSAYWLAGKHILTGSPIYSAQQLSGLYPPQQQYLYLYPPFLAVVVAPLAALFDDYRHAAWIWTATGAVVAVVTVVALARVEGFSGWRRVLLLVGATFALPAVVAELVLGNVHVLLLGLLSAAWLGVRRGGRFGEVLAGVAVGIAALIKIFPALIVLWFVLTARRQAAVSSAVAIIALVAFTLPFTGPEPWLDYPTVLANLGPPPGKNSALAPTVWLADVMSFTVARVFVTVAGLGVVVWSARRQPAPLSFGVSVMVSLLVAPALYHTYLSLSVLPFMLALAHLGPGLGLALSYLGMLGGEQPALGDLSWIVRRGLPTLGALGLTAVLLRGRRGQAAERAAAARTTAAARPEATSAPSS